MDFFIIAAIAILPALAFSRDNHGIPDCGEGTYIASEGSCTSTALPTNRTTTPAAEEETPIEAPAEEEQKLVTPEIDLKDRVEFIENEFKDVYGDEAFLQTNIPNAPEVNYGALGFNHFQDRNEASQGNSNKVQETPQSCQEFASKAPNGIVFVRPTSSNELGAVLFNGQSCSGVKRTKSNGNYKHNIWPSASFNGSAKMYPDRTRGESANFKKGRYGPTPPVWLGDSGSVQIHSLSILPGESSLAGISSAGCLVVNQNCMAAIHSFVGNNKNLTFSIYEDTSGSCTKEVNDTQNQLPGPKDPV